jgi:hypothetical protein
MIFAQILVGVGLVMLAWGLLKKITAQPGKEKAEDGYLLKRVPGDWKDSIYNPVK